MNHHNILLFPLIALALTASYAITLPVTVAYEQADFIRSESHREALETSLMEAKLALVELNDTLAASVSQGVIRSAKSAEATEPETDQEVPSVPFYSQFADISDPSWQKVSCGVASLAMLIDHYGQSVAPDTLLRDGRARGAYITSAGWSHAGLINLSQDYGLDGESVSLSQYEMSEAFSKFSDVVAEGPVMASVHYTFEPTNPIPHLVVITGVADGQVYYNDPAEPAGGGSITIEKFQNSWKKRYISIRPTT